MDQPAVPNIADLDMMSLKRFVKGLYFALLLLTVALTAIGIYLGYVESLILTLPIIVIMCMTIFTDRKSVHIPPFLIMMLMGTFYLSLLGRVLSDQDMAGANVIDVLSSFLVGVNFGILGLILVYMLLKSMPKVKGENPTMVSYFVLASTLSLFTLMKMLQYYIAQVWDDMADVEMAGMMEEGILAMVGSLLVCALYHMDERSNIFTRSLNMFLEINSEYLGIAEREREDIENMIRFGESERLEFKSTVRRNLETGENDKRMEKAVLKTMVAFLNADGGNLLIGVKDDGEIIGADVDSFDNKDKMGLHLTNLISSQIGKGFLPYITVSMVDFDDRTVVRVRCEACPEPVFLKDGKVEIFYARMGPQTVERTGMALIDYIANRRKKTRKLKKALNETKKLQPRNGGED